MSIRNIGAVAIVIFSIGTMGLSQTSRHVVIHAGHVLDVKTGKLLGDQTLVMDEESITAQEILRVLAP